MGAIRFFTICLAIMALGVVLVAGLPAYPGKAHAIRGVEWRVFCDDGGSVILPDGWQVFDPFTSHTVSRGHAWIYDLPPRTCRMMLARSPDGRFEVFVTHGPRESLEGLIARAEERFDDRHGSRVEELPPIETADGLSVRLERATLRGGYAGDHGLTAVLGVGELGDHLLIVNGGGPTDAFDQEEVLRLVRQVRVPHF